MQRVDVAAVMDEFAGNPLADGSQPELFVDNSDAENVVVSGDWKTEKNAWSAYGPDFLSDDSKGTFPKSLRYVPRLPAGNEYDIYVYFPKVGGATTHTLIRVFDGGAAVRPEDPVVGRGRRRTDRRRMGAYRPLSAARRPERVCGDFERRGGRHSRRGCRIVHSGPVGELIPCFQIKTAAHLKIDAPRFCSPVSLRQAVLFFWRS